MTRKPRRYSATINYLSEPIDVFSEWIDHCEAEQEEEERRLDAGDELRPSNKRRRLEQDGEGLGAGEAEAMADPREDPALHAGN